LLTFCPRAGEKGKSVRGKDERHQRLLALQGRLSRRDVVAAGVAFSFAALSSTADAYGTQQGVINMPDPMSKSPFAEPLIRIGEVAIAKENDAALDAYFSPDFQFHGPAGDMSYGQLKAYFAALRAAFTDLQVRRAAIIGEGFLSCCSHDLLWNVRQGPHAVAGGPATTHRSTHRMGGHESLSLQR
jgi:hypothetical protein